MATVGQVLREMRSIADDYRSDEGGLDLEALVDGTTYALDLDTLNATHERLLALAQGVEAAMIVHGTLESREDAQARLEQESMERDANRELYGVRCPRWAQRRW